MPPKPLLETHLSQEGSTLYVNTGKERVFSSCILCSPVHAHTLFDTWKGVLKLPKKEWAEPRTRSPQDRPQDRTLGTGPLHFQ